MKNLLYTLLLLLSFMVINSCTQNGSSKDDNENETPQTAMTILPPDCKSRADEIFEKFKKDYEEICPTWERNGKDPRHRASCQRAPNNIDGSDFQLCHLDEKWSKFQTKIKYVKEDGKITSGTQLVALELDENKKTKRKIVGAKYCSTKKIDKNKDYHVVFLVIEDLDTPSKPDTVNLNNSFTAKSGDIIDFHFINTERETYYKNVSTKGIGDRICKVDVRP